MSGIDLTIICVEKNKFAFNTILALKTKEPEEFDNVITIQSDMRDYNPDTN
jgi:hypothetical protein